MERPSLVDHATKLAESRGFRNSCLDEFGELLYILSGSIRVGTIAEIGTGCGVSTAWLASATSIDVFTVENDKERANAALSLFIEYPNVHQIVGDWEQILCQGPFKFVFVDAKPAKLEGVDQIVNATEVGGLIVIDDLTPVEFWPEEWKGKLDLVRDAWLHHNQLASIEVRTSAQASAILARRIF